MQLDISLLQGRLHRRVRGSSCAFGGGLDEPHRQKAAASAAPSCRHPHHVSTKRAGLPCCLLHCSLAYPAAPALLPQLRGRAREQ